MDKKQTLQIKGDVIMGLGGVCLSGYMHEYSGMEITQNIQQNNPETCFQAVLHVVFIQKYCHT